MKILSLSEYERRIKKRKMLIIFLSIFIIWNVFFHGSAENCTTNLNEIVDANDKWIEHWFNFYDLGKYTDPITRKPLTLKKIQHLGLSISKWESNNNHKAKVWEKTVNGNSYGQYCILSTTAKALGWNGKNIKDLFDVDTNAKYATKYLCIQLDNYKGNIVEGLAAYNAGKCRVNKKGKIRNQHYVDNVYPIYVSLNIQHYKYKGQGSGI